MAESEELKSLLVKVKVESEKVGLKLNIQKTKIMASGPITPWEIDGETVETVSDFISGGAPKSLQMVISTMKLKTLPPWKESYDQPRWHIQKQRHYFANKGPSSQGCGFSSGHVWMWELDYKESWALKSCGVGEDYWESLGLQGDPTSPFWRRPVLDVYWKDWYWGWNSNTLATSCLELTHWKRPWSWEWLGAGGEGDDRGWDGWMASPTQCTCVRVNSRSWWWTGRLGMLRFMGTQRVGYHWVTEVNWTEARNDSDLQRGVSGWVLRRCKPLDVFWRTERICWQLLCMWEKERSQGSLAWEQKVWVY